MKKGHLIELLSKFTLKEIKEFGEYVSSPFFNKNQSVIKLYEYLMKQYPQFEFDRIQKEYVYGQVFPHTAYNDGFMRTIMFNLSQLAEEYLAYKRFKTDHFFEKRNILYELNERKLDRRIEKDLKFIFDELDRVNIRDKDYYYERFLIEYEYFYYLNRVNLDKVNKFISNSQLERMFDHITYSYLLQAVKLYTYSLTTKELYNVNIRTDLFDAIINKLDPELLAEVPSLTLYYNLLMLHLKPDDFSYFHKVKDFVCKHEGKLSEFDKTDTFVQLENYCKAMQRKGHEEFNKELFLIINIELEKKCYHVQGLMSAKYYVSAIDAGLKMKNYEWVRSFIEKYKNELPSDKRENTYFYGLSLFEFAKKNFDKSLELLSKVKYNEIYHNTEMRCMMTCLYYELNYDESFLAHVDTFRHFIANDKTLPDERKQYYSNFITFAKRLFTIKNKQDGNAGGVIYKKIADEPVLYNKEWLQLKAKELID